MKEEDFPERFTGVWRLYGKQALRNFMNSHICVTGLGGVGSWAAEALARSGIGRITLVDPDVVVTTNINRQIQALKGNLGKSKAQALAERIKEISPDCRVTVKAERVTPHNLTEIIVQEGFDYVIEAIDDITAKAALIAFCSKNGIPLVTSGGAGGKTDPTRIAISDLSRTEQDPLLSRLRRQLRQKHDFPRGKESFDIAAVYSTEQQKYINESNVPVSEDAHAGTEMPRYGTTVVVTAAFGMTAASVVLRYLADAAAVT